MIRVLLVDDSPVIRQIFARLLAAAPDIEVVGEAGDPFEARDRIVELEPDVLLLDVEMPRMDGITFLRRLMYYRPTPVIVCSSLTSHGGEVALAAIQAGAVEVIGKPSQGYAMEQMGPDLVAAVRIAATAHPQLVEPPPATVESAIPRPARATPLESATKDAARLIAIGASTGGVVAIETVLRGLPREAPAVVIAQHMPPYMTQPFAERLSKLVPLQVEEARDGVLLRPGSAWVAPGGKHLSIIAMGNDLRLRVREGPRVNGHRPSVDVLFHSVAELRATPAIGVLLTGMGRDGARGLLAMRQSGAATFAQDEQSSVVWGMPKAALELEAVDAVLPLDAVAGAVLDACRTGRRRGRGSTAIPARREPAP